MKREMKQKKKIEQGRETRKDYGKLGKAGIKLIKTKKELGK